MPGRTPGPTGVTVLTAGQARDVKQVKRNSVVRTIYSACMVSVYFGIEFV